MGATGRREEDATAFRRIGSMLSKVGRKGGKEEWVEGGGELDGGD